METKNIILKLRTERGMSQDELADKIMVTRQAVSRWENGDTVPNTDTLKLLSKEFDVSINTLLGEPRKLICQCFGILAGMDFILVCTYIACMMEQQIRRKQNVSLNRCWTKL